MANKERPTIVEASDEEFIAKARVVTRSYRLRFGYAQAGDALGTLSYEGPEVSASVGTYVPALSKLFPEDFLVNLSGGGGRDARSTLTSALHGKYIDETIDWVQYNKLVGEVLDDI